MNRQKFPDMFSATWLLDMAFLSDVTGDFKLQCSYFVTELYSWMMAFMKKLNLFQLSLAWNDLKHFINVKIHIPHYNI